MAKVPALLKWIGNKQRFAETIISYMPKQFNNYYEPFLGSGAVMAQLLYQNNTTGFPMFNQSYASDILPFLIDIFNIVKYNPTQIKDYYAQEITEYYCNPDKKYNEIRDRFNQNHNALDFCLLSRTCYSGIIRFRKADGYMSTPKGPHNPIKPETFSKRVDIWHKLISNSTFTTMSFEQCMDKARQNDVIYCDPPYTHSQSIIYGAQAFNIEDLFRKISDCKSRGVYVMLSINGTRESDKKDISITPPPGLFEREISVNCGTSMIDRLQNAGQTMNNEVVHDKLLLTW
ncbi:MAG: Dam family site-specific DNA-(adenine-N6)-methyltransferase [Lachnospiraceae bacterium]|nr:Dam family site-specific DNA-(adenine-N6)-methyltransferase [Lachnospiraceae bacterium]